MHLAKNIGFIPHDSGSALHRRGLVQHALADTNLEVQRLCARKAALQVVLEEHRLELDKGTYQTLRLDRQRAEMLSRKRARESRVRGRGSVRLFKFYICTTCVCSLLVSAILDRCMWLCGCSATIV